MDNKIYEYLEKTAVYDEDNNLIEYDLSNFAQTYCKDVIVVDSYVSVNKKMDNPQVELIFESSLLPLRFAMYFYIDNGDLLYDWTQYIFNLSNDEDMIRKDFQDYYNDDCYPYTELGDLGCEYLIKNNYVNYNERDDAYHFTLDGK